MNKSNTCSSAVSASIDSVKWLGLRCKLDVKTSDEVYAVLRTKPSDESSNISAKKKIKDGKCALIVEDDELEGSSAVLVLLDESGESLDKRAAIVGD